jgi:hypothetical protein
VPFGACGFDSHPPHEVSTRARARDRREPSYEAVRQYVHVLRRERERRRKARQTLVEVALYLKPVHALDDLDEA